MKNNKDPMDLLKKVALIVASTAFVAVLMTMVNIATDKNDKLNGNLSAQLILGGTRGSLVLKPVDVLGTGDLDTTFATGTGANTAVWATAMQSDGKVLIGGSFTSYNGVVSTGIARLNTNGTLDTSFSPGTTFSVTSISIQPDGKIIAVGANGGIARLNTNGSLDASFNTGTGISDMYMSAYTSAIQADGKIIVGGNFITYNGTTVNGIIRLNTDGSLDTSFNTGTGLASGQNHNSYVWTIAIQPDGKVLIGGSFDSYNGVVARGIARLNTDGSLDSSFNTGTGFGEIRNRTGLLVSGARKVALQPDGKIITVGAFTSYNGVTQNYITRLNANGTLDTSFNSGTGLAVSSGAVAGFNAAIVVQPDGKIIIGGSFGSYNNVARIGLVRINSNGSLDTAFNGGVGLNNYAIAISSQSDGKIIIGGYFTSYNGTNVNYVARIKNALSDACTSGTDFLVSLTPNTPPTQNTKKARIGVPLAEYAITACKSGLTIDTIQSDLLPLGQTTTPIQRARLVDTNGTVISNVIDFPTDHLVFSVNLPFSLNETKVISVFGDVKKTAVVGSQVYLRFKALGWTPLSGGLINFSNTISNIFTVI